MPLHLVDQRALVPAGSAVHGTVTHVRAAGRMKGAAELTIYRRTEFLSPAYYTSMGFGVPASVGAPFVLRIVNGAASGQNRISSGWVKVNGVQVVGPADFGQSVALIERTVPGVRKAVRWNSPFYGVEGRGWFLGVHCITKYVKVAFFRGTLLKPPPPGPSKSGEVRYVDLREQERPSDAQMVLWVKQAAAIPGWGNA